MTSTVLLVTVFFLVWYHDVAVKTWGPRRQATYSTMHGWGPHLLICTYLITFTMCDVTSWHIDRTSTTVHMTSIELQFNSSKFLHDVDGFLVTTKISALVEWHSDSYTSCSCLDHIKLFHSIGAGRTRMQLVKVVIASVLVLSGCAEGLPEGTDCVFKCTPDVILIQFWWGCTPWLSR